jgi:hypothetical protein
MATTLVFPFEITILLKKKERILFFSKVAALPFYSTGYLANSLPLAFSNKGKDGHFSIRQPCFL